MLVEHYGYALNQDNELVHIRQALKKKHLGHNYRCPNPECNAEMLTVQGTVKVSHFRHKNAVCSLESYQHQLAKKLIQERIHSKQRAVLAFDCSICGSQNAKLVDLSKTLSHATLEHKYPDSNFIGDVAAFDHNNELKVMFEVYVTHKVEGEKLKQPKWVEVVAEQVNKENYHNNPEVKWRVSRSCADIICSFCEESTRLLHDQDQKVRIGALLDRHRKLEVYGDIYYAGIDFFATGLKDINTICYQIEVNNLALTEEDERQESKRISDRNAYISLLYHLHWVKGFCILLEIDDPITHRANKIAQKYIKPKFWNKAQKQKRMLVSEHPSAS